MKILISSHFPFIPSGYAIQTERLISGLYKHYPDVEIGVICWNYSGLIMPNKKQFYTVDDFDEISENIIPENKKQLYKDCQFYIPKEGNCHWKTIELVVNDYECDKLIVYQDIFLFKSYDMSNIKCKKYLYLPVHDDFREHKLLDFRQNYNPTVKTLHHLPFFDKIATFSSFGVEVLNAYNYPSHLINHIIDDDIKVDETREELRKLHGISNKDFVCLMVARNTDTTDRKGLIAQLLAFAMFRKNKKNCKLFIHENSTYSLKGSVDLEEFANQLNIKDDIILTSAEGMKGMDYIYGLYKLADVLLCASKSEGFGIPMVEAQFMDLPVISTNCTSMTENTYYGICTEPHEISTVINGINSWSNPSAVNIKAALEIIYKNELGNCNHDVSPIDKTKYSTDVVMEDWLDFLDLNPDGLSLFNTHLDKLREIVKNKPIRTIKCVEDCKYNAVLIETRNDPHIEPILLNLIHLTDETIGMQIFYHEDNSKMIHELIQRNNLENISLIKIEDNITNTIDYNRFVFSKEFYDNIVGEKILIYQLDSLLFETFDMKYFDYDWVGAVWNEHTLSQPSLKLLFDNLLPIGNGGFNIRDVDKCRGIAIKYNYEWPIINNRKYNEDNIYSFELQSQNANFPTVEDANKFAVETVLSPNPMAMHATYKYTTSPMELDYISQLFTKHLQKYE